MAVLPSTLSKFGMNIGDGNGMVAWPRQPRDMVPSVPSFENMRRIDGTAFLPKYLDLTVTFELMLPIEIRTFQQKYFAARQKVSLNLPSALNFGLGANNTVTSGWIICENVRWTQPPFFTLLKNPGRGNIFYAAVLNFERVEHDGVYMMGAL